MADDAFLGVGSIVSRSYAAAFAAAAAAPSAAAGAPVRPAPAPLAAASPASVGPAAPATAPPAPVLAATAAPAASPNCAAAPPAASDLCAPPPPPPPPPPPSAAARRLSSLSAFLLAQHMPLGLFVMVLLGYVWPAPGIAAGATALPSISLVGIFLLAGLNLATADLLATLRAHTAVAAGLASILLLSPLLALAVARLPLAPREFALGLALFLAMPTTTSTGVLITAEAGGSTALALLLSVVSNVVAVFSAPLFVAGIFDEGGVALSVADLLRSLALTVLLPLAAGKALRSVPFIAAAAVRYRLAAKLLSSALLIAVPWVVMSRSAAQLRATPAADLAALAAACIGIHLVLLAANLAGAALLPGVAAGDRVAVVIMGSQKTINLAAAIVLALPVTGAVDPGLVVLPCIFSHFCQTVIDAVLGTWWGRRSKARAKAAAEAGAAAAAAAAAAVVVVDAPPALRSAALAAAAARSDASSSSSSSSGGGGGGSDGRALLTGAAASSQQAIDMLPIVQQKE